MFVLQLLWSRKTEDRQTSQDLMESEPDGRSELRRSSPGGHLDLQQGNYTPSLVWLPGNSRDWTNHPLEEVCGGPITRDEGEGRGGGREWSY